MYNVGPKQLDNINLNAVIFISMLIFPTSYVNIIGSIFDLDLSKGSVQA